MKKVIDLVLEDIDSSGNGEPDEEWQHQQSGIEMPPPYGSVKIGCKALITWLSLDIEMDARHLEPHIQTSVNPAAISRRVA
ncbi:hypothetical protein SDC9_186252 [bioreactor metagenome]|uniref:Uncharacterized protein n=1 Tax=bioreactor metagenome TaxID=1076179 RepID=A0A645HIE2_9ZZZZ